MSSTDVIIRYIGDSSRLRSEVGKVEGTGGKMKAWAVGIAGSMGVAFAVDKLVEFAGAASAVTESMSKVDTVFGDSAKSVKDWAKTTTDSIHVSEGDALAAVGTFGNLAVALGLPTDQAAAMSQKMVELAADLGSFNNVPTEEALAALQSGLLGEAEPLRKFGVSLSAARIEAEALSSGLAKAPVDMAKVTTATEKLDLAMADAAQATAEHGAESEEARKANLKVEASERALEKAMAGGKVELDAATKAQATYALIMKDTETAQGDVARTGDTMAGKQKELNAKWEDAQVQIGEFLVPAMSAFFDIGSEVVDKVFELDDAFEAMVGFVKDNVTWLTPLAAAMLALAAPTIAAAVASGALAVAHTAQSIATGLASTAMGIFNAVMSANPIFLVIAAIGLLVAGFLLAYEKVDWFRSAIDWLWQALQDVWDWVSKNWPLLLGILTGPIGWAVLLITKNWDTLKEAAAALYEKVKEWLGKIATFFSQTKDKIAGYVGNIKDFFVSIGRSAQDAYNKFKEWIGKIPEFLGGLVDRVRRGAERIADAIKSPINAVIRGLNRFRVPEFHVGAVVVAGHEVFGGATLGGWDPFSIPELAAGGIVRRPTLAMIGEAGPEAVIPLNRYGANTKAFDRVVDSIVATNDAAVVSIARTEDSAADEIAQSGKVAAATTVRTGKAAIAAIERTEKAATVAMRPVRAAVPKSRAETRAEGFAKNLAESLREIGRPADAKNARRIYEQAGRNFMNLPADILAAFRRAGTFFEDYSFRKFAAGGIVTRPTLGMIGEAGPEAVIPLGRRLGNVYNITVEVPPTADQSAIGRATVDAIAAYERRNGASWRAS